MKKALFIFVLVFWPVWSWAWSAAGHGDIAIAALEQVPEKKRKEFQSILMEGPWAKGNISWKTAASRAAAWPDRIRDMPLRKLFGQYGSGSVPPALQAYRKDSTKEWHYVNTLFIDTSGRILEATQNASAKSCPPAQEGMMLEIWPHLFKAYEQAKDPRDKAIVLSFILHMVGDAYQPLHVLGSVDGGCRHDRGGNGFCTAPIVGFQAGLRCRESLHYLWDQGFGVFADDISSKARFSGDPKSLTPALKEVRKVAESVYPKKSESPTSESYKNRSRKHVETVAKKASEHLAAALKTLP